MEQTQKETLLLQKMKLSELFKGYRIYNFKQDTYVEALSYDTRRIVPKSVFFAIRGTNYDGHDFVDQALEKGAVALVLQKHMDVDVPYVVVENTRKALSELSARFYGYPSSKLKVIGITGTNGKTTTSYFIYQILRKLGRKTALIGTIEYDLVSRKQPSRLTTPESLELQAYMKEIVEAGGKYLVMEVSSHALSLHRVDHVDFDVAIFTNLSQDHLDFHGTFENYLKAKLKLFRMLKPDALAIINADDPAYEHFVSSTKANVITYSLEGKGDVNAHIVSHTLDGLILEVEGKRIHARNIFGRFNAYNLLACYSFMKAYGIEKHELLSSLELPKGRLHRIGNVFIDYSHTPDALHRAILTLKEISPRKVIVVFGAGGNRDREKRPIMGKYSQIADMIILTNDNPRFEDPRNIIKDIQKGIEKVHVVEYDREKAIRLAMLISRDEDVVLVAGKGHENYQEIEGVRYPFSDEEVVLKFRKEISS